MEKITVTVALPDSATFTMHVNYQPQKNDAENIDRALAVAASLVERELNTNVGSPAKSLYQATFRLRNGGEIIGYSNKDEPERNGKHYHCAATKDLKGRIAVLAEDVAHSCFTPI